MATIISLLTTHPIQPIQIVQLWNDRLTNQHLEVIPQISKMFFKNQMKISIYFTILSNFPGNSSNLFANNNDKDGDTSASNNTVIDNAVTNSNGSNSGSRKQSMDLSNGALDLTRRINETLARHGKII